MADGLRDELKDVVMEATAEALDKTAARAAAAGAARRFFREWGVASWAFGLGVAAGAYVVWIIINTDLALECDPWYFVNTWTVFGLGFVAAVGVWMVGRLMRFVTRGGRRAEVAEE